MLEMRGLSERPIRRYNWISQRWKAGDVIAGRYLQYVCNINWFNGTQRMQVSTTKMTAQQFLQLGEDPPGVRLELVDGEVAVSPSPTPKHSFVVMSLARILGNHIDEHDLGELHHDVDTLLDIFNVRRPDMLFYSKKNLYLIGDKAMEGPPDLAIEVISPSSVAIDRKDKFDQYRAAGVRYYWIVDPQLKTIEGWQLKRGRYISIGRGQGSAKISLAPFPDLEIPPARLWRK